MADPVMMTDPATLEALKSTKLASELDDAQCRVLANAVTIREFSKDEIVIRESTSDNHLYVILAGALSVVHRHGHPDAETLFCLDTGDFVGELGFHRRNEALRVAGRDRADARALARARGARGAA